MSAHPEQRRTIIFRARPDPAVIRGLARERRRRYLAGKLRIDFYADEQSVAAINSLMTPYTCASTVLNRLIAEWAAHRPGAGAAAPLHSAGPILGHCFQPAGSVLPAGSQSNAPQMSRAPRHRRPQQGRLQARMRPGAKPPAQQRPSRARAIPLTGSPVNC
jgi:hypothetical protein